jgi:hypothetical protein
LSLKFKGQIIWERENTQNIHLLGKYGWVGTKENERRDLTCYFLGGFVLTLIYKEGDNCGYHLWRKIVDYEWGKPMK